MTRPAVKGYPDPLPNVLLIDMRDYPDFRALGYRPVTPGFNEAASRVDTVSIAQADVDKKNEGKR